MCVILKYFSKKLNISGVKIILMKLLIVLTKSYFGFKTIVVTFSLSKKSCMTYINKKANVNKTLAQKLYTLRGSNPGPTD